MNTKNAETYRRNVERIKAMYPNKELLTIKDVAQFLGRSNNFVARTYPFRNRMISVATLASYLTA